MTKPLEGYRIIELAGIGPGPYAGQLLADMGAEIILINRPGPGAIMAGMSNRGKRAITLDLRKAEDVKILLKLVETADAIFEGLRPGVVERLGVGPDVCQRINPKLVYGRMTGWGQTGPWAKTAGHDINYISITGALEAMGKKGEPPMPPLNLIGDFGGGSLFLVSGILAALLAAQKTGRGEIVDAAMIDGVSSMLTMIHSLSGMGQWREQRESNLLDGGMPYYRCYKTSDEKFMAVGCIEPQFFALALSLLNIDPDEFGGQHDAKSRSKQHAYLEKIFAAQTRDHWAAIFDGTDACISPVLSYAEAPQHPQNKARGGLKSYGPFVHPRSAPVFMGQEADPEFTVPSPNAHAREILTEIGCDAETLDRLT